MKGSSNFPRCFDPNNRKRTWSSGWAYAVTGSSKSNVSGDGVVTCSAPQQSADLGPLGCFDPSFGLQDTCEIALEGRHETDLVSYR